MLIKHRDGTTSVFLDVKGQILDNTGCIKISIQGMGKMIIQRTRLFLGKSINFKYCFSLHISENLRRDTHNKKIKELICHFFWKISTNMVWNNENLAKCSVLWTVLWYWKGLKCCWLLQPCTNTDAFVLYGSIGLKKWFVLNGRILVKLTCPQWLALFDIGLGVCCVAYKSVPWPSQL